MGDSATGLGTSGSEIDCAGVESTFRLLFEPTLLSLPIAETLVEVRRIMVPMRERSDLAGEEVRLPGDDEDIAFCGGEVEGPADVDIAGRSHRVSRRLFEGADRMRIVHNNGTLRVQNIYLTRRRSCIEADGRRACILCNSGDKIWSTPDRSTGRVKLCRQTRSRMPSTCDP